MNLFSYIKQRIPIVDVINDYASLKKAGNYYKGCCPFHHERTASFTVTPHKEIFYCFGCHAGGDVISFIARIEQCSPLEAARFLIERHSLSVPADILGDKTTTTYESKKGYYKTCDVFSHWCQTSLSKYPDALAYVTDRSISSESIQAFGIGYCPADLKSLLMYAQKEGILAQNFIDAHLVKEGKMGLYLAFDDRIIFPIKDHLGHTVGFGGRVFKPHDERAKYLNSHEHEQFNKSKLLFGLDRAKKVIAEKESAFLVEGYTDLIIMHQFGYTNTVATLGTACTLEHLQHLARYAQKLYIMYDGDAAGQKAIMRLTELCWEVSLDPFVITLPKEDDPASYLLKKGSLEEPLAQAQDIFSFAVHHLAVEFETKSLQGKLAITQKIIGLIKEIKDPIKRELLLAQASESFNLPLSTLHESIGKQEPLRKAPTASLLGEHAQPTSLISASPVEKKIIAALLNDTLTLSSLEIELLTLLTEKPLNHIIEAWSATKTEQGTEVHALFEQLSEEEKAFVSECMSSKVVAQDELSGQIQAAHLSQIFKKQWKKKVHDVKLSIDEAEKRGEKERVAQLLYEFTALKNKMLTREST